MMKKFKTLIFFIFLILVSSCTSTPVNAKDFININDIPAERKLLYGEKETFISCWSGTTGSVFLDLKVSGKWVQIASAKLKKDIKTCLEKGYPGLGQFVWTPNELSTVKGEGRSYILEFRQRYGSIKKPVFSAMFTMPIYRNSNDLIADFAQSSPLTPTPTPTPTPQVAPLSLTVGQMYSGINSDYPDSKWVAIKLTNNSNSRILRGSFSTLVSLIDANGGVVHTSRMSTPTLLPGTSGWLATTQFNTKDAVRAVLEYSIPKESLISPSEFPTISGITIGNASGNNNRKSVQMTIKNNSDRYFLNQYSNLYAVLIGSSGVPIYSVADYPRVWIAPGGSSTVQIGSFTLPVGVSSIEVSIKPALCKVPETITSDYNNCFAD